MASFLLNAPRDLVFNAIYFNWFGGTPSGETSASFLVLDTPQYRLEVTGSGLALQDGRPVASETAIVSGFVVYGADGRELVRIAGLDVTTGQIAAVSGSAAFYALLTAGNDVFRLGNDLDFASIDPGAGADTVFGDLRDNSYFFDDAGDRVVEPANGGEYDYVRVNYGAAGQTLAFSVGSGRLAGIEELDYEGLADVRINGNRFDNVLGGSSGDDTLGGGGGDDILGGNEGNDSLLGGAGNDDLRGGVGDDLLLGGAGDDSLYGGTGLDTLMGGAGNDFLSINNSGRGLLDGGSGNDAILVAFDTASTLRGGAGNDTLQVREGGGELLQGGAGHDSLVAFLAEFGSATVDGGSGNDTIDVSGGGAGLLLGGTGNDQILGAGTLDGGAGNDILEVAGAPSLLLGGAGDDLIRFRTGDSTARGGTGRDVFEFLPAGGAGHEIEDFRRGEDRIDISRVIESGNPYQVTAVEGGVVIQVVGATDSNLFVRGVETLEGSDFITGSASLTGTGGGDVLQGALATSLIDGAGGNDWIEARAFGAEVRGGTGNDTISVSGEAVGATLDGGAGNDLVIGGAEDLLLLGGAGADTMRAMDARATLEGGAGNDLYEVLDFSATLVEAAGAGIDTVLTRFDFTLGENFEHLTQRDEFGSNWRATGNELNNRITGGRFGSSNIFGADGNDTLIGGYANDTLLDGGGADRLTGGRGADVFVLSRDGELDTIVDFSRAQGDRIDIRALVAGGASVTWEDSGRDLNLLVDGVVEAVLLNQAGLVPANADLIF
ncbi:MAG: hypothetical protein KIT81_12420 [Alphaproteobacteria bacterium]|nr:hypothetical protein [Alphaproteobacteria bacterium]